MDVVTLEILLELSLVKHEDAQIPSVAAVIEIFGDLGCPVEPSKDSLVGVAPGRVEELEEAVQNADVVLHPVQVLLLPLRSQLVGRHLVVVVVARFRLRQHFCELFGEELGLTQLLGNERARLVDHLLEATTTAVTDEFLRRTGASTVLVVALDVLGCDVLVRNGHDPLARLTLPVLTLMEVDTEGALRIVRLQLLCCEGNA